MADSVSPPPEVPADVREAAIRAFHGAFNAIGAAWDLSFRIELAARSAFAAGVAAGRTQAAQEIRHKAQRVRVIANLTGVPREVHRRYLEEAARIAEGLPEGQD